MTGASTQGSMKPACLSLRGEHFVSGVAHVIGMLARGRTSTKGSSIARGTSEGSCSVVRITHSITLYNVHVNYSTHYTYYMLCVHYNTYHDMCVMSRCLAYAAHPAITRLLFFADPGISSIMFNKFIVYILGFHLLWPLSLRCYGVSLSNASLHTLDFPSLSLCICTV